MPEIEGFILLGICRCGKKVYGNWDGKAWRDLIHEDLTKVCRPLRLRDKTERFREIGGR